MNTADDTTWTAEYTTRIWWVQLSWGVALFAITGTGFDYIPAGGV